MLVNSLELLNLRLRLPPSPLHAQARYSRHRPKPCCAAALQQAAPADTALWPSSPAAQQPHCAAVLLQCKPAAQQSCVGPGRAPNTVPNNTKQLSSTFGILRVTQDNQKHSDQCVSADMRQPQGTPKARLPAHDC